MIFTKPQQKFDSQALKINRFVYKKTFKCSRVCKMNIEVHSSTVYDFA